MNSRQMKQAMKKMGVEQEELDAQQVIIRLADRDVIIDNPDVAKVNMMGQDTFQVSGGEMTEQSRETAPSIEEEDVTTVAEQAGVDSDRARQALEDTGGDIAQAIMTLQEEESE
ncbi:MAG: nascent polypeptide-associated complex protein [Candidatus Woesearchaeota archaeon]